MRKRVDLPMAVAGAGIGIVGCILLAESIGLLGLLGAFLLLWGNNLSTGSVKDASGVEGSKP